MKKIPLNTTFSKANKLDVAGSLSPPHITHICHQVFCKTNTLPAFSCPSPSPTYPSKITKVSFSLLTLKCPHNTHPKYPPKTPTPKYPPTIPLTTPPLILSFSVNPPPQTKIHHRLRPIRCHSPQNTPTILTQNTYPKIPSPKYPPQNTHLKIPTQKYLPQNTHPKIPTPKYPPHNTPQYPPHNINLQFCLSRYLYLPLKSKQTFLQA